MNIEDYPEFQKCMAIISETYSKPSTDAKLDIWWSIFKPYESQDFKKAVFNHVTNPDKGTFEPKPADILRHMPEPKPAFQIENKGSVEGCEKAQQLRTKYLPLYKKLKADSDDL